jgi:hypothetical protein
MSNVPRILGGLVMASLAAAGALLFVMVAMEPAMLPAAPFLAPFVIFFLAIYAFPVVLVVGLPGYLLLRSLGKASVNHTVALAGATGVAAAGVQRLMMHQSCRPRGYLLPPCSILEAWGTGLPGLLLLGAALGVVGGLAFWAVVRSR